MMCSVGLMALLCLCEGVVDLLGTRISLPQGTEQVLNLAARQPCMAARACTQQHAPASRASVSAQAFLALAFGIEGFLMGTHKKHEALDQSVHTHLAGAMLACAAFAAVEVAAPRSLLLSSARILACLMQGMWLIAVRMCIMAPS